MRTRFSKDEITEFKRLTDEIKIAARDIARKFRPSIPLYEPWALDLYLDGPIVTLRWDDAGFDEEFDICDEWFGMTDEELDEVVEEERRRKEQIEKDKELDRLKNSLRIEKANIARIEKQIEELTGEDK
ncbi:MAG: hypothetical protein J6W35_07870 [Eubacterium sp.]|nr:hypothetical protein [Eubacterium sp.]